MEIEGQHPEFKVVLMKLRSAVGRCRQPNAKAIKYYRR